MVSLLDPTLQRLVEVNPVPVDFELPPVSDNARLEAILERGRTEQLRSRLTQRRSWRPGLAVAAATFVVVLIAIGVLNVFSGMRAEEESPVVTEPSVATTTAPVPTTATTLPAPPSSYDVSITSVLPEGTFTASGPAVDAGVMCGEGTITVVEEDRGGNTELQFRSQDEHTLVCADGTGEMRLSVDLRASWGGVNRVYNGEWNTESGSGSYEAIVGSGELTGGGVDGNRGDLYEYSGSLERSATEATTTTTTVPPVVEQFEVTIIHPEAEPFSVSGPAVGAGLACTEGTIDVVTISKQPLISRFPLAEEPFDNYAAVEEHTLVCDGSSGTIVVAVYVNQSRLASSYLLTGKWWVVGGGGDYERVAGTGDFGGRCDGDRSNCSYEYTGRLGLSREFGTAPIVQVPTGRQDVAITYEGSGAGGWFNAAGSAVESGLVCPQGTMVGIDVAPNGFGHWEHTFFCADGSERMTLEISVRERQSAVVNEYLWDGRWTVIGGAGGYESVTGTGKFSGVNFEGNWASAYTGYLEISE